MKNKKILKSIIAFIFVFGLILSNLSSVFVKAEGEVHKTKTIIHKVLMNRVDFDKFNQVESDKLEKYNGNAIQNIKQYFGQSAEHVEGVAFRIFKEVDQSTQDAKLGSDQSLPSDLNAPEYKNKYFIPYKDDTHADGVFLTGQDGTVEVTLDDGTYVVIEDKIASTYKTDGKQLTAEKAIPFKLELPITKLDGTGLFDVATPLHVYPKNTDGKPEVEKDFADEAKKAEGNRSVNIGDEIPYVINTTIPKDAVYKTVKWEDTMVKGLDFKMGSIEVKSDFVNKDQLVTLEQGDYEVVETIRGFTLKLKKSGLTKLETAAKNREVKFEITYKGILNETAEIETPIPNEVKFHYGNHPGFGTEPKPGKPSNGQIIVNKTWDGGVAPSGVTATFKVYEKVTGKEVGKIDISSPTLTGTLTGLDNEKEYIVIEDSINGYLPDYAEPSNGTFGVTNKKNPNPEPLKPVPPKVITFGKKFIKTNDKEKTSNELKKLSGAEFIVIAKDGDNNGKYLALKDAATQNTELTTYKEKEKTYTDLVAASTVENPNTAAIAAAKAARDVAYEALNMQWTYVSEKTDAFVFVSSTDGKFEVRGLTKGNYALIETKAPAGYALLPGEITFSVGPNSYEDATGIEGHSQIKNREVTIPQTGGMGTVIFTVVGALIMGSAVVAMRRRKTEEE